MHSRLDTGKGLNTQELRIGYLMRDYPQLWQLAMWREMQVLRELGVGRVYPISDRQPPIENCRHEFGKEAHRETLYLAPAPRWSNWKGLLRSPGAALKARRYVTTWRETPYAQKMKSMWMVTSAMYLARFARQREIHHIHCHGFGDAAHLAAICRVLGGPTYSLTLHDESSLTDNEAMHKMSRASFVACPTQTLAKKVIDMMQAPAGRVPAITLGVDTEVFVEDGSRRPRANRLHLVSATRLTPGKGHADVLKAIPQAVAQGIEIEYSIAGDGPEKERLVALTRRLGLGTNVKLVGGLSEMALVHLLRRADVLVYASNGLGEPAMPTAIMEAMSCGLPVISTTIGGTGEMINHGREGLLVRPGDENALSAAIVRLAKNLELRNAMGQAARQRAVQLYDCRKTAGKLLDNIRAAQKREQNRLAKLSAAQDEESADSVKQDN